MEDMMIETVTGNLREEILATGARLFLRAGYHGVGMREIAAEAGASKALLYYHFRSKADLFRTILEEHVQKLGVVVEEARQQAVDPRGQLERIFRGLSAWPSDQRAMIYLAKQEARHLAPNMREAFLRQVHDRFIGQVEAILRAGMENKDFRPMDAGLAVQMLLGAAMPVLSPEWRAGEQSTEIDPVLEMFFEGLVLR